jgi:hypothetical protein
MIAIAMLIVCVGCVSALTVSTSTVSTKNGDVKSTNSTGGYSTSTGIDENVPEADVEIAAITSTEEVDMKALNSSTNCTEASKAELIVKFEPEHFESTNGTLNALAMEEAEFQAHSAINATVLSDLTEIGMPGLQLVKLPDGMSLEEGIAYYESLPGVRFAEPNYQISISSEKCVEADSIDTVAETSSSGI